MYLLTIMLKCFSLRLILQSISLILFVYQKHILSTPSDDSNLEISGCTLVRSDHRSNNKRESVCIYYKSFLPLRILNVQYLQEPICFELKTWWQNL